MHVLLPVAGISISILLLIIGGAFIGVLCGLLGVGGGFMLTPLLITIGVPPVVAAASGTNTILATSSSGVAAHLRLKNVDLRMGAIAVLGGLAGSAFGVRIMEDLEAAGSANLVIDLSYIVMLGAVGFFILRSSVRRWRSGSVYRAKATPRGPNWLSHLPLQIDFPHSQVRHSVLVPLALCVAVGLLTAIMGVGGGFMLVPVMVYMLGMPAHVAVGTSLFQILFTCLGATFLQAGTNHTVDIVLALLLAIGSTIGAQAGAQFSRRLRGEQLMGILGVVALAVALKMTVGIVTPPVHLLKHPTGSVASTGPDTRVIAGTASKVPSGLISIPQRRSRP